VTRSHYARLSREQLAVLLPELLSIGQMIDRSGMAWCIQEFGREEMVQIAVEEWAGATPVHDRWHGEFHLDHCGALLDVEPMGPDYVFGMCHTIDDPTFDATAVATNARAGASHPPARPQPRRIGIRIAPGR